MPVAPDPVEAAGEGWFLVLSQSLRRRVEQRLGRLCMSKIVDREVGRLDLAFRLPDCRPKHLDGLLPEAQSRCGIVQPVAKQAADQPHHRQCAVRIHRLALRQNPCLASLGGSGEQTTLIESPDQLQQSRRVQLRWVVLVENRQVRTKLVWRMILVGEDQGAVNRHPVVVASDSDSPETFIATVYRPGSR